MNDGPRFLQDQSARVRRGKFRFLFFFAARKLLASRISGVSSESGARRNRFSVRRSFFFVTPEAGARDDLTEAVAREHGR